ncbi:hypothetical protein D3C76_768960 [compost metagenome]
MKLREVLRRCSHLRIKGGGPGGVTDGTDGVDLKGNQRPGLVIEEHPFGLVEAPLQRAITFSHANAPRQRLAQRRQRVVVPEPFGNRVGHDKGALPQCAHQYCRFQYPQVFARCVFKTFDIDQASLGLVGVVSFPFMLVGKLEKGERHFSTILVPARHLVDVPDVE